MLRATIIPALLASFIAVNAQEGPRVLDDIASPVALTLDIAFDGEYLWVAGWKDPYLYQVSVENGSVIRTIPCNVETPRGLAHDGTDLLVTDSDGATVYRVNENTGAIISSFVLLPEYAEFAAGTTFDGTFLWSMDTHASGRADWDHVIFNQFDDSGNLMNSFRMRKGNGGGLAWDGAHLWYSDNYLDMIYEVDPTTGKVLDSLEAPGGDYPNGMTFDGEFLWMANGDNDRIYRIEIDRNEEEEVSPNLVMSLYPNPFEEEVLFEFELMASERVTLQIMNSLGQQITVLENATLQSGHYRYTWTGNDGSGLRAEPGTYYAILTAGHQVLTEPVIRGR